MPDGTPSTDADRVNDARQLARHYGQDVFNNHCLNHEHDCKATCVKYVKKRLEAKNSLRSNKVPACRFCFRKVKVNKANSKTARDVVSGQGVHSRRRRAHARVPMSTCARAALQKYKQRRHQVTNRCNVDDQFLSCAPPLPPDVKDSDATQLVACSTAVASTCALPRPLPPDDSVSAQHGDVV